MSVCDLQTSGAVELYFYGELDGVERARLEHHLRSCAECRRAIEDLETIRTALAAGHDVAAPAEGNWAPFMTRLNEALRRGDTVHRSVMGSTGTVVAFSRMRSTVGYLAMAALLALVTISVLLAWRMQGRSADDRFAATTASVSAPVASAPAGATSAAESQASAFATLSERHFERSKLVVLGLATKDPSNAASADWEYERELAETLLSDTRLYRLAAEERGLASIARVMEDLELVLLQASMSDKPDASSLEQLQRLIRKRDLVTKMELVTTTAGI